MINWRSLTIIAVLCQSLMPPLHNKAIQTHGVMMNLVVCQIPFVSFLLFWLITHRHDLSLITRGSFALALIASILSLINAFSLFGAFKQKPAGNSVIMITCSFSFVLIAVINHLMGYKMQPHQWLGAVIAFLGIVLVNLKQ